MKPIEAAGHAADIELSRQLEAEEGADFAAVGRAAITAFLGALGEDDMARLVEIIASLEREGYHAQIRAVLAALKEMVDD